MLTKKDQKFLLDNLASKQDISRIESAISDLKRDIGDLTDAIGAIFQWTDNIHRAIVGKPTRKISEN